MAKGFVSTAYMIIAGIIVLAVLLLLLSLLEGGISKGLDWVFDLFELL